MSSDVSKISSAADTSASDPPDSQDLTVFVQSLLEQMQARFTHLSDAIIGRIDEMGARIDELEKSIGDLIEQYVKLDICKRQTNADGKNKNQEAAEEDGKNKNQEAAEEDGKNKNEEPASRPVEK
ncbi:hypothetical protein PsorP6_011203 [Peronosclerospora sorghi]|uniref:Uncharacterized protein n=1 Tax=Peronosclerospora sorghi TaxID=230839 RepID=A0ACC0VX39_9STRA|nr:hypothetical protein PsorP6_011203 [Peronosclerospora sorghi]